MQLRLGRHVLADATGCDPQALDDAPGLGQLLRQAAEATGAQVLQVHVRHFTPHGLTGMAIISTSHLTVHTWPEHRFAAIDAFTCGENDPWPAVQVLLQGLGAGEARVQEWPRGLIPQDPGPTSD